MKYKYTDDDMVKGYILEAFKKYYIYILTGASSPPRQPRQLPGLIFETKIN